jgi:DNA-directed RNA polymerase subunit H (RpoH/RPB5)
MTDFIEEMFKIKYESLVMLKERGYVIPSEEADILNQKIKMSEFKNKYVKIQNDTTHPLHEYFYGYSWRVSMTNVYYKDDYKCLVYFADTSKGDKKIADSSIARFCQLIINQGVDEAIIVSSAPQSGTMESLCSDIKKKDSSSSGVFIQFFEDIELKYNPLIHDLVPKHRILTKKESDFLKNEEKLEFSKFPQISIYDPVCKRIGAKSEDVIEITRKVIIKNCLIDEELSYRYVYVPHISKTKK